MQRKNRMLQSTFERHQCHICHKQSTLSRARPAIAMRKLQWLNLGNYLVYGGMYISSVPQTYIFKATTTTTYLLIVSRMIYKSSSGNYCCCRFFCFSQHCELYFLKSCAKYMKYYRVQMTAFLLLFPHNLAHCANITILLL